MAIHQQNFINVPNDERHATTWFASLVEEFPDIAEQVAVLQASTGSAIATLEG